MLRRKKKFYDFCSIVEICKRGESYYKIMCYNCLVLIEYFLRLLYYGVWVDCFFIIG